MRARATRTARIAGVYAGTALAAAGAASCFSSSNPAGMPGASLDGGFDSTLPAEGGVDAPASADTGGAEGGEGGVREAGLEGGVEASVEAGEEGGAEAAVEGGAPDAAAEAQSGCVPGDAGAFAVPSYLHEIPSNTYYCDAGIGAIAAGCFGDAATYSACNTAVGALSTSCAGCVLNASGSAGALEGTGLPAVNVAGCIALQDPSDAGQACAYAVQSAWACEQAACPCGVTDDPSAQAQRSCMAAAASGVCAAYATAASACLPGEGTVAPYCAIGAAPSQQFLTLAAFFCTS